MLPAAGRGSRRDPRGTTLETRAGPRVGPGGGDPLADVFPGEDHAAGLALEAADVPLLVQRQERLAVFDLLLAPGAVCEDKRTLLSTASGASDPGRQRTRDAGKPSPDASFSTSAPALALAPVKTLPGEGKANEPPVILPESSLLVLPTRVPPLLASSQLLN